MGSKASALLRMLRGVVDLVSRTDPAKLEPMLKKHRAGIRQHLARAAARAAVDRGRARRQGRGSGAAGREPHDRRHARRVRGATASIAQGGATTRLAQAFQALVPDNDRRPGLLEIARVAGGRNRRSAQTRGLRRPVEERGRHADVVQRRAVRVRRRTRASCLARARRRSKSSVCRTIRPSASGRG